MKIAIFTDTYLPQINGVARTYQRLLTYLTGRGIGVKLFAPSGVTNAEEDTGHTVTRFLSCNFFLYPECQISFPNYLTVHRELEQFRPDLIHLATPFLLGLTGLKYANSHAVPKVAVFHTDFPQYLDYYGAPWLKKVAWRFLRWFHRQADQTFCPSHDTVRLLTRHGIGNLSIWRRGVDADQFSPAWRSAEFRWRHGLEHKIVLLYVGRLAPEKNVDTLLQALSIVNRSCGHLHLLIVGDGPQRRELELLAPANTTFLGYRSGTELSRVYASADLFVCPSVTETFGNVVLEAMASSLPVIAPLAGGIKENLFPGNTGLDCLPRNPFSMAAAILRLIDEDGLRRRLARQALEHARNQSWDAVLGRLVDSYQDVIHGSRSRQLGAGRA
ncbi:glycosyl transferases group 1 [Lucifera butyrica]|uniref:Glycosyl transferases group 1 n=1 Tax=Lucifera butyrica TaxID=1351585 RepID=A0A498RFK4_9FIRM|nr:glycosyltransferase family 1 protein [Lucifera butyrica]VBB09795.1 glycosyl transferases group 1 [Lucifera butyrica]